MLPEEVPQELDTGYFETAVLFSHLFAQYCRGPFRHRECNVHLGRRKVQVYNRAVSIGGVKPNGPLSPNSNYASCTQLALTFSAEGFCCSYQQKVAYRELPHPQSALGGTVTLSIILTPLGAGLHLRAIPGF